MLEGGRAVGSGMVARNAMKAARTLSAVLPTFERGLILLDTVPLLRALARPPDEILVVDQTPTQPPEVAAVLAEWDRTGAIRWLRLPRPSIPGAMNAGLLAATHPIVLYLDDDIVPWEGLVEAHLAARETKGAAGARGVVVAGRVLQPWDEDGGRPAGESFSFAQTDRAELSEFMAGNVSLPRREFIEVGGFDERFRKVAFRFEAEAARRLARAGLRIVFEPAACIRHLRIPRGGTRAHGDHLRTWKPAHAVGAYYYLLRARPPGWVRAFLVRPWRAIRTRHHLARPWWIVPSLVAEAGGALWALVLFFAGPALIPTAAREAALARLAEGGERP